MSSLVALWCAATDGRDDAAPWVRHPSRTTLTPDALVLSVTEARLVERLRLGDEEAFRECYDANYVALWRYAVRLLGSRDAASDVVQDVFFSLFSKRETLVVRGAIRTYLFGAVRHAALNLLRHDSVARRVATGISANEVPALGARTARPDDELEQHDIEARVMRALATLPERQRSAMILRWEHGLTTAQIARTLGIADTVAGRLLHKAAAHLRRMLTAAEA